MLIAPLYGVRFNIGLNLGVAGFVAAVIGGLGSTRGAIVGGYLVAAVEGIVGVFSDRADTYRPIMVFALFVLVLTLRPTRTARPPGRGQGVAVRAGHQHANRTRGRVGGADRRARCLLVVVRQRAESQTGTGCRSASRPCGSRLSVIGLNVLLGYTGLLSLGHWAFFIVGGFVGAIWTVEDWGLNPWLGFPIAFVVGMALGALLALTCCHLRGFYLTVVTIAFGILVSSIALLFDSHFNGLSGRPVTKPLDTEFSFISSTNPNRYLVGLYWIGVGMLLVCLYMVWNLVHSRWGRAYKAIREAEVAAGASGVPTYRYKVSSFALSAGMVSLAGVLAAQTTLQVRMVDGTSVVGQSFQLVIDAVVGGLGTLAGPIVGAFAFTLGLGVDIGGREHE